MTTIVEYETEEALITAKYPSWYDLSKFGWASFRKHPNSNDDDFPSVKRVTVAAKRVFDSLEESDQRIIMAMSDLPQRERETRYKYLCWVLACEAGLTSRYQSIPPQEHYHPPNRGTDQIITDSLSEEEYNEQAE